eukprot:1802459-Pleurochrysis_carterae.AAC.1
MRDIEVGETCVMLRWERDMQGSDVERRRVGVAGQGRWLRVLWSLIGWEGIGTAGWKCNSFLGRGQALDVAEQFDRYSSCIALFSFQSCFSSLPCLLAPFPFSLLLSVCQASLLCFPFLFQLSSSLPRFLVLSFFLCLLRFEVTSMV